MLVSGHCLRLPLRLFYLDHQRTSPRTPADNSLEGMTGNFTDEQRALTTDKSATLSSVSSLPSVREP